MVRLAWPRTRPWFIPPVLAAITVAVPAALTVAATPAQAAGTAQSVSFACIGFPQYFNVPPGVTYLAFDVAGAAAWRREQLWHPG